MISDIEYVWVERINLGNEDMRENFERTIKNGVEINEKLEVILKEILGEEEYSDFVTRDNGRKKVRFWGKGKSYERYGLPNFGDMMILIGYQRGRYEPAMFIGITSRTYNDERLKEYLRNHTDVTWNEPDKFPNVFFVKLQEYKDERLAKEVGELFDAGQLIPPRGSLSKIPISKFSEENQQKLLTIRDQLLSEVHIIMDKLSIRTQGDDKVNLLWKYLLSKGFLYPKHLASQFYTALKTKGFVILSGLTGTGKTKIAQELAELTSSVWASEMPNVFSKWEGTDYEFENALREIQRVIKENGFATLVWGPEGEVRNVEPPFVFWVGHQSKVKAAALVMEKYSAEEALGKESELSRGFKWNLGKYNESLESAVKSHQSKYGSAVVFRVAEVIPLKEPVDVSEVSLRVGFKRVTPFKNLKFRDPGNKNFLFLSVRPDWRDSKALLGYYNPLTGEYHRTKLLCFLLRAVGDYQNNGANAEPYFLLLDEMNLAHVEYYFADFLSVLESGRDENGFSREPLRLHDNDEIAKKQGIPKELKLPPNLYIIGTVNMDETTYSFSPKVLDRAFVVEFHDVDLENYPPANRNSSGDFEDLRDALLNDLRGPNGKFLARNKEEINRAVDDFKTKEYSKEYWQILQDLNRALEPYDLHFGYRVVDEIALFFKNARESQSKGIVKFKSEDEIFDLALLVKVLPKFHGNRKKLEKPLKEVLKFCSGESSEINIDNLGSAEIVEILKNWQVQKSNFRFKHTARKVLHMLRQLYEIGFASFS